ncbi:TRAP transporter substrate-binding protein [Roseovarius sp. ZX-A-9]|uniref:TRAP transporter substrate-binding protein n=1 Tax=Roseovarius sp. ZX-A-9 TaxID=3014783 RepID=UPI0023309EA2|nr:TRAP transporter substrate-binding protein [Roseovarius sp. ZX-A-9]
MKYLSSVAAVMAIFTTLGTAIPATAQEIQEQRFNVLGTWSSLNNYSAYEEPFWKEILPADTDGKLTGNIVSMSEMGLKGFETIRLLKQGIFDFVHLTMGYAVGDEPAMEGLDLAAVSPDIETARAVVTSFLPALNERMEKNHSLKILSAYPFESQALYCKHPVESIADLEGLKIRSYSAALADFVTGVGASNVTVAFSETLPALEKGVVDCALTSTMAGYQAKWHEVATHFYPLSAGWGIVTLTVNLDSWNRLDDATRSTLEAEIVEFDDRVWEGAAKVNAQGILCNTGSSECEYGEPGNMILVEPSEEDRKRVQEIVRDNILPGFAERCDAECVSIWNETAGKVTNYEIGG